MGGGFGSGEGTFPPSARHLPRPNLSQPLPTAATATPRPTFPTAKRPPLSNRQQPQPPRPLPIAPTAFPPSNRRTPERPPIPTTANQTHPPPARSATRAAASPAPGCPASGPTSTPPPSPPCSWTTAWWRAGGQTCWRATATACPSGACLTGIGGWLIHTEQASNLHSTCCAVYELWGWGVGGRLRLPPVRRSPHPPPPPPPFPALGTFRHPESKPNAPPTPIPPPLHSRLYARYFGGDLQIISMEGYGTDAYLHLNRLGNVQEPLP